MAIIDFHSHILPGADHGSSSLETSLAQLELMKDMGTSVAVATPHFYPNNHTLQSFLKLREKTVAELSKAGSHPSPTLLLGAEVLVCGHLEDMEGLDALCIKGTKVLLLELPFKPLNEKHIETVEALMDNGYTVVLAHIDRYIKHSAGVIDTMLELGALAQINAEGFERFGKRRKLMHYIKNTDRVCALGSDLHGANAKDYKRFVNCKKLLGEYFDIIMSRTEKLLDGAEPIKF